MTTSIRKLAKKASRGRQPAGADITARKSAEAALRRSQQELADFLHNAPLGLHWAGPDGYILWANQAELDMLGYLREEYVGHHIAEFHADQDVIDDILQRLGQHETLRSFEARLRCKDGSIKYVLIDSNVLWKDGKFIHTRCFTRDITERKRLEAEFQTRVRQQVAVAEFSQQALAGADPSSLMDEMGALVTRILETDYCEILELQPDGQALRLRAGVGWKPGYVGHTLVSAGAESPAGYALLSNRPVIVEDLRAETRFASAPLLLEHEVVSGMSVIVQGRDRPFGVLGAHTTHRRTFTQDDIHFLQAVANVLATAIERGRYAAQLQDLAQASLALNSAFSLDQVTRIVAEKARDIIGAHQSVASVTVDDHGAQAITAISLSEKYAAYREYDAKPDSPGLYQLVWQTKRPVRMTQAELEEHPAWRGLGKEASKHPPLRGWLAAPLIGHNHRNIGLIALSDKFEGEFTADDEAVLAQMAQVAFIAVENAQFFGTIRRQVEELTALHRVAVAATEAASEDAIIERTTQALGESLYRDSDHFGVLLVDEAAGALRIHPSFRMRGVKPAFTTIRLGRGITGSVAQDGKARRIPDVTREPVYLEGDPRTRSELCVPVKAGERVVGVINAESVRPAAFSEADERLLTTIAGQLATAIERKRLEAALRESEEKFSSVFRHSPVAISLSTPAGPILDVNDSYLRLTGYRRQEVIGRSTVELGLLDAERHARLLEALFNQGALHDVEFAVRTKAGELRDWLGSLALIELRRGLCILAIVRDVTERKRAEREILQRNDELAALNQMGQALTRLAEPSEILEIVYSAIGQILDNRNLFIALYDEARQTLSFPVYTVEGQRRPSPLARPFGNGLTEYVILSQAPLLIPSDVLETETRLGIEPIGAPPQCLAAVPMLVGDQAIGVIALQDYQHANVFNLSHIRLLSTIAGHAAIAISNARLFEEVRRGREGLLALSQRLLETQETERRSIARELHDEIGQVLTGLKLTLEMSARLGADTAQAGLDEAQALVQELMDQVHDLSLDLRPTMLDDLGLLPAVLSHFERYTAQTGVDVNFEHRGLDRRFASAVETAAYRIVQEALTNVARHAGVSELRVHLWVEDDTLDIQIEDTGTGFDPEAALSAHASSGLVGMRERAALLGGQLRVESAPGLGTQVFAQLPVDRPGEQPHKPIART